jgi:hypothetical protein
MKHTHTQSLLAVALVGGGFDDNCCSDCRSVAFVDDGKAKQSIVDFVAKVAATGSPDFVPVAERGEDHPFVLGWKWGEKGPVSRRSSTEADNI